MKLVILRNNDKILVRIKSIICQNNMPGHCCTHRESSQLIDIANQLTGFYMSVTLT